MSDILDTEDYALLAKTVIRQAGPAGIAKPDLEARVEALAEHLAEWKVSGALYTLFVKRDIDIKLTDDGSDIVVIKRSGDDS